MLAVTFGIDHLKNVVVDFRSSTTGLAFCFQQYMVNVLLSLYF